MPPLDFIKAVHCQFAYQNRPNDRFIRFPESSILQEPLFIPEHLVILMKAFIISLSGLFIVLSCRAAEDKANSLHDDGPIIDSVSITAASCGQSDGAIAIWASGAQPLQYSIDFTNFGPDNTFTGLPGSTVFSDLWFVVRDAGGREVRGRVFLPGATPRLLDVITTPTPCDETDGAITFIAEGGSGPLEYSIDGIHFQDSPQFNGLPPGSYPAIVRDSIGCTASRTVRLTGAGGPKIWTARGAAGCDAAFLEVDSAGGGVGPLTFSIDGIHFQEERRFEEPPPGWLMVLVQDARGCRDSFLVNVPDNPYRDSIPEILAIDVQPAVCSRSNGSVFVTAAGPGPLTYALDTVPFLESPSFTGLAPGKYTVFVRAGRLGCPAIREVEVAGFEAPAIRSVEAIAASCGQADGSLTLFTEEGVPPLTYSLNEGASQTASLFPDLARGRYEVIVRDGAGCEIRDSVEVAAERCRVFIPNAFSPNDDGINDRFHIFTPDAALAFDVFFQVFDRWGGLVYQYSGHQSPDTGVHGWDGTIRGRPAGAGTYLYFIEIEFDNGEREQRSGTLTLLR